MSSNDIKLLKNNLKNCDKNQLIIRDKNSNKMIDTKSKEKKDLESTVAYLKKQLGNKTTPNTVKNNLRNLRDTYSIKLRNLNNDIKKLNLYNRCVKGELKCRVAMKRKIVETTTTTTTTTTTKSYEEDLQFLNYNI